MTNCGSWTYRRVFYTPFTYQDVHLNFFLQVYPLQEKPDLQVKFDVQALGSIAATSAFVATGFV